MYKIVVQPYKGSLWVQRGKLYDTKEEAEKDLPYFTDGTETGPWAGAKVEPCKDWEIEAYGEKS